MKQIYLTRLVGDGQTEDTAFRPAVADSAVDWSLRGASGRGQAGDWCLIECEHQHHEVVMKDPHCLHVGGREFDGKHEDLPMAVRTKMVNAMMMAGLQSSPNGKTLDEVVKSITQEWKHGR